MYARSAISTPPATTSSMQSSTPSAAGSSSIPAGPTGSWGNFVQDLDASSMPAYQRKLRQQLTPLMSAVPSERSLESSSTELLADQRKPSGQFAVSSPAGSNTSSSWRVGVALPTTLQGAPGMIPGVAMPAPAAVTAGSAAAPGSSSGSRNPAGVLQHLQQQSEGVVGLGSPSSSRSSWRLDVPVGGTPVGTPGGAMSSSAAVTAGSFGGGAVGQAVSSSGRIVPFVPQHLSWQQQSSQQEAVIGLGGMGSSNSMHSNVVWSGRDFLASIAGMGGSSSPGPHARDARMDGSQHDASSTTEWANSGGGGRYNDGGSGGSLAAGRASGGQGTWSSVDPAVMLETWLVLELCDRSVEAVDVPYQVGLGCASQCPPPPGCGDGAQACKTCTTVSASIYVGGPP
jgi:hypothetical protein